MRQHNASFESSAASFKRMLGRRLPSPSEVLQPDRAAQESARRPANHNQEERPATREFVPRGDQERHGEYRAACDSGAYVRSETAARGAAQDEAVRGPGESSLKEGQRGVDQETRERRGSWRSA